MESLPEFFGTVKDGYSLEIEVAGSPGERGVKTYQVIRSELYYKYAGKKMVPIRILTRVTRVRAVTGKNLEVFYFDSENWNFSPEFPWSSLLPITGIYLRQIVRGQKAVNQ